MAAVTGVMMTVFVDASYCPETGAAGWGAWAKAFSWDAGRTFGGVLRDPIDAGHAELRAAGSALVKLANNGMLDGVSSIMLQSDCFWALQQLREGVTGAEQKPLHLTFPEIRWKPGQPDEAVLVVTDRVNTLLGERDTPVKLLLRHVKGHQGGEGRSWVNRTCDRIAREHMMVQRTRRQEA